MRVYVNDRGVETADQCSALGAVRAVNPDLARRVEEGTAYIMDGRAIRLDPGAPLDAGAILRVVTGAPRTAGPDADA